MEFRKTVRMTLHVGHQRRQELNSRHEAGHPKLVLCDSPEGKGVEGGGRGVQDGGTRESLWPIHVDV